MGLSQEHGDAALAGKAPVVISERDIVFNCPSCDGELVVDRDGAGITCACSHCGRPLTVPQYAPVSARAAAPAPPARPAALDETPPRPARQFDFGSYTREQLERRLSELRNQHKENQSQDTEMRGHINRATMELHRLQLRLKTLQERQAGIEAEAAAARKWLETGGT